MSKFKKNPKVHPQRKLPFDATRSTPDDQKLKVSQVLSIEARAPAEWPESKRKVYETVENSLIARPEFRHLSVLPEKSLYVLVSVEHLM